MKNSTTDLSPGKQFIITLKTYLESSIKENGALNAFIDRFIETATDKTLYIPVIESICESRTIKGNSKKERQLLLKHIFVNIGEVEVNRVAHLLFENFYTTYPEYKDFRYPSKDLQDEYVTQEFTNLFMNIAREHIAILPDSARVEKLNTVTNYSLTGVSSCPNSLNQLGIALAKAGDPISSGSDGELSRFDMPNLNTIATCTGFDHDDAKKLYQAMVVYHFPILRGLSTEVFREKVGGCLSLYFSSVNEKPATLDDLASPKYRQSMLDITSYLLELALEYHIMYEGNIIQSNIGKTIISQDNKKWENHNKYSQRTNDHLQDKNTFADKFITDLKKPLARSISPSIPIKPVIPTPVETVIEPEGRLDRSWRGLKRAFTSRGGDVPTPQDTQPPTKTLSQQALPSGRIINRAVATNSQNPIQRENRAHTLGDMLPPFLQRKSKETPKLPLQRTKTQTHDDQSLAPQKNVDIKRPSSADTPRPLTNNPGRRGILHRKDAVTFDPHVTDNLRRNESAPLSRKKRPPQPLPTDFDLDSLERELDQEFDLLQQDIKKTANDTALPIETNTFPEIPRSQPIPIPANQLLQPEPEVHTRPFNTSRRNPARPFKHTPEKPPVTQPLQRASTTPEIKRIPAHQPQHGQNGGIPPTRPPNGLPTRNLQLPNSDGTSRTFKLPLPPLSRGGTHTTQITPSQPPKECLSPTENRRFTLDNILPNENPPTRNLPQPSQLYPNQAVNNGTPQGLPLQQRIAAPQSINRRNARGVQQPFSLPRGGDSPGSGSRGL